ncbi:palindromic element RPE1 domain-containing protein [Candidatus Tisiphia endosymbiont of Oplodontha viridula]|uniref:palindromic element RPE1 domain-containing protein n=1 Tax=Candidatus Tisiphia endosymbiont of Oplodontha viridula TaxID=3077925 RepID=UPI0035C9314D
MLSKLYNDLILQIKANKYDFLRFELIKQDEIKALANQLTAKYDTVIIIGFGASCLNVRALLSMKAVATKRLIYLDNLDQLAIDKKLALVNLDKAVFFSLSRSGNTNETYLLTKYVLEVLRVFPQNVYVIVPFSNSLLYNLAKSFGANCLEYDNVSSGRFGIISNASLIPATTAGVDVDKVVAAAFQKISDIIRPLSKLACAEEFEGGTERRTAAYSNVREDSSTCSTYKPPAGVEFRKRSILDGSSICQIAEYYLNQYSLNRHMLVMFNYSYQLDDLCRWQQQIIAESLGKNGFGITPIIAKGTFDQHSQLQLYLEGPDDKFYKIITNNKANSDIDMSLAAHANNIYNALVQVKRPVLLENFVHIDEDIIVDQIIHTMLSTILIANYLKIDPFSQPSVDQYKL